ncbi:MAG: EAL domain-containing protein [Clostridiales bacterium]|nr:EAL domain-containing protein [Clostridiales bacterium]
MTVKDDDQNRLSTNTEVSKVGSWSFDFGKRLFFATNETYLIFGRRSDEFDGSLENVLEFIVKEDRDAFIKGMEAAYRGIPLNIKFQILTPSGALKQIQARAETFYHTDQTPDVMMGTVQDYTEQSILTKETELKLLEIERAQQSFLIGSWALEFDTMKFDWSDVTYEIYGLDPKNGAPDFDVFISKVHPDDRILIMNLLEDLPKENPFEIEFRIVREHGNIRHIKHLVEITHDGEGNPKIIRGNIQDITHQKEMEEIIKTKIETLNQLTKRIDLMVDHSTDVFEIIDETGLIKYISPAVEHMMGMKSSEIEGRYIWDFVEGNEKAALKMLFKQCIDQPHAVHNGSIQANKKDGEVIFLEVTMNNHVNDPEVNGIVLNWKDITAKVRLDKKVHQMANYDELTGLPNRSLFKSSLAERIDRYDSKDEKFAVFMIDIDEFKGINNVLSFEFGDNMIKKIGMALNEALLDKSIFLSRFYGDQFGLIVDQIVDIAEGQEISERILNVFNRSFVLEQYELFVNANIGFSIYPDDSIEIEALIKFANIALSRAKDMGKQKYQAYSPLWDVKSYKEFALRNDFKKAIENNELEVYYQPIVNLKTGQIIGGEALTRWNHPDWGQVPPTEFIPIAESTGLIIPMGKWLLNEVCKNYKSWIEKGLPLVKISVNYSALQFYQVNFVNEILETIRRHQLSPDFMILEITESVLINQSNHTENDLSELKKQGIQIAIDDFGTGYSSLTYLSSMNIDVLKIDRGFIDEFPKSEKSAKVLIAIINLAKDLNIKLVAEGVSEWEHLSFLRKHNCYAGQGYLFSRPLPEPMFEAKLAQRFIEPVREEVVTLLPEEEQRHSERITLAKPIEADMTITEIMNKPVKVGQTKALIRDIGMSGLSFNTNVRFPVKNDIVLQFMFELNGIQTEVRGTIIWTDEIEPGEHLFGFEFIEDESNMAQVRSIISTLNKEEEKAEAVLSIFELIEKSDQMPKIPEEIFQILEMLYDPTEIDIQELASKVNACDELNQLLLENINSGYFKIVKKIFTIEEAIILLGMRTVLNLIVFFVTKLMFEYDLERKSRKFDIHHYWRHVLGTSVAAQMISQKIKKGDKHLLFTYGLIHDIGIPVLDNCLPKHLDQIAEKVLGGMHQIVAEKIVLGGLTHSDVGAWLCKKWQFRDDITEIVLHHHTPLLSESNSVDTMIVYVADVMSTENNEKLLGLNVNMEVSAKVLDMIGLTKEAYDEIASNLSREIEKVGTYFLL